MHTPELLAEKVRFLYAGSPVILMASALAALTLVAVHWGHFPAHLLLGWLAIHGVNLASRIVLVRSYRRRSTEVAQTLWLRHFRVSVLAGGLSWGLAGVMLTYTDAPVYQAFVAFSLAGINAGAITSLAIDRPATLLFVVPSLSPLAIRFLLDPDPFALVMGLIVLLFLLFITIAVTRIETYLHDNVRLRLIAEAQGREILSNEMRWSLLAEGSGLGLWDWDLERGLVTAVLNFKGKIALYSMHWRSCIVYGLIYNRLNI